MHARRLGRAPGHPRGRGIRCSAVECFAPLPRSELPALESIGERLHGARLAYMRDANVGLTQTYNALADESVNEPSVERLRELHRALDRAVLDAYDWGTLGFLRWSSRVANSKTCSPGASSR